MKMFKTKKIEWIQCYDGPIPEDKGLVIYDKKWKCLRVGYFKKDHWIIGDDDHFNDFVITHWCDMPYLSDKEVFDKSETDNLWNIYLGLNWMPVDENTIFDGYDEKTGKRRGPRTGAFDWDNIIIEDKVQTSTFEITHYCFQDDISKPPEKLKFTIKLPCNSKELKKYDKKKYARLSKKQREGALLIRIVMTKNTDIPPDDFDILPLMRCIKRALFYSRENFTTELRLAPKTREEKMTVNSKLGSKLLWNFERFAEKLFPEYFQ